VDVMSDFQGAHPENRSSHLQRLNAPIWFMAAFFKHETAFSFAG
jgi:hypothetical protein